MHISFIIGSPVRFQDVAAQKIITGDRNIPRCVHCFKSKLTSVVTSIYISSVRGNHASENLGTGFPVCDLDLGLVVPEFCP